MQSLTLSQPGGVGRLGVIVIPLVLSTPRDKGRASGENLTSGPGRPGQRNSDARPFGMDYFPGHFEQNRINSLSLIPVGIDRRCNV